MLKIYITENVLSDGSRTYDVHARDNGTDGTIVLHAITYNSAIALAYALARSIDQHAINDVKVIRAA